MNRRFAFLAVVMLLIAVRATYADWSLVQVGGLTEPSMLYKVQTMDRNRLYVIGRGFDGLFDLFNQHLIYRSLDAGSTLEPVLTKNINPFTGGLCNSFFASNDLHFSSPDEGFVVGAWHGGNTSCLLIYEYNWIAQTTDAGDTWADSTPTPVYDRNQINAVDINGNGVGMAVGDAQNLWKTTDGGVSWTLLPTITATYSVQAPLHHVDVVTDNLIFVTSEMFQDEPTDDDLEDDEDFDGELNGYQGELFRSVDGGQNWTSLLTDPLVGFHRVVFSDAQNGLVLAVNEEEEVCRIRYTINGGVTWNDAVLPNVSGVGLPGQDYLIADIQMLDAQNGWAVGGDGYGTESVILRTTNGGHSWTADAYRGVGQLLDVHLVTDRFGYAVGTRKVVVEYYVPGTQAPIADAGPDDTIPVNTIAQLDGSGSYDPDGDPLTYAWTQTAGSPMVLSDDTSVTPTFFASQVGVFTFRLVVSDFDTSSAPDTVTIEVVDDVDDDADDDLDDDADDDSDDDFDDDFDDDDDDDDDDGQDDDADDGPFDCRSLLSMLYDVCDAYLPDYEARFDAEQACDEDTSPWDCAVQCRTDTDSCDDLFECLEDTCGMNVSRNTAEDVGDDGDISGGCSCSN